MAQNSLRIDDDARVTADRQIPLEVSEDPFYSKENMNELERRVANIRTGKSVLKEHDLIEVEWCENFDFKYVKEGNKMTDAMKELYDIFKEDIDQEVLEKSKNKWIKEGRKEGVINTLLMLVKDGIISVEDAAKRANLSVSKFQKYLNEKM